jgi:ATP-dependent helicase/nuclease subunit A
MVWTKAQQKVIDIRNKNVLVSAAAGSGKTAVLVERIISMISDDKQPIDIDHLLVVTFTNAAAAQMRDRIGKAIEEKLLKEPDNVHLQKQVSLLQSSQITTIHSFCLNVIRNYFHRIDMDPSFKIAEDSEITLMKSDVISDVLERWYEEEREDFHSFIESYSYSKSDSPIEKLVLQLYHFSMSNPWPKIWLMEKQEVFEISSLEELKSTKWMKELINYVEVVLCDLIEKNEKSILLCNDLGGPSAYLPALAADREILKRFKSAADYEEYAVLFKDLSYVRLSSKKEDGVIPDIKEKVKALREEIKKGLKELKTQFFYQEPQEMVNDLRAARDVMQVLFALTMDFMDEYARKKEEKNLIDFNDLEHFALKILVEEHEGEIIPTQAALELSEQFEEILIDEYQDSNLVQETLLKSISREKQGLPNRFMVGDVKQSIYKFRLAMPELFMEKYKNYLTDDNIPSGGINYYQRINLDKNFRSRKVVLDYVNTIFKQIMQESVGGIVYNSEASLVYGQLYETNSVSFFDDIRSAGGIKGRLADSVELILVTEEKNNEGSNTDSEDAAVTRNSPDNEKSIEGGVMEENSDEISYTKKEIEARMIAGKIKELTDPDTGLVLYDSKAKSYRTAAYRDIVILLRSMTGWSEVFVNILMQEGIAAYADTGTGYFQTMEIMTLLNILKIIDNPRQDIPLAGVLYSPIVGLTTTQLAMVRASAKNGSMHQGVCTYLDEGEDKELILKLKQFMAHLDKFRSKVNYMPIHELLQEILDQTGFYFYVSAMHGGERRKANLDMLISQAVRFEKGSYSGLFHFIRYIEKLHKYDVDFKEAVTLGEQDNTVRIMSIHKSKGLEFPIVFIGGMNKQFNTQDLRSKILLHNEYGVGPEYIDCVNRTKIPTLLKKLIQKKVQIENLGEELRVLYVAMTRAKEKLIMTGYLNSNEELRKKEFSFFELISAKSYLDYVLPATINVIGTDFISKDGLFTVSHNGMTISIMYRDDLLKKEIARQVFYGKDMEEILSIETDKIYDESLHREMKIRSGYLYPYENDAAMRAKMTVSELKKLGQFTDDAQSENIFRKCFDDQAKEPTIPDFIQKKKKITAAADRGILYHKILELLDLTKVYTREDMIRELEIMAESNRMKETDLKILDKESIYLFINSNIAKRMRQAQLCNKLYKEKQFVIGIKACELVKDTDSKELILVQGIIDAFFEEDEELVLIDYKSDFVRNSIQLIKRYQLQLEYYRKALEQISNKKVKEMIIYSLHLNKEIRIDS